MTTTSPRLTLDDIRARADTALASGRVSQAEYDYLLAHAHEHYPPNQPDNTASSPAPNAQQRPNNRRVTAGLLVIVALLLTTAGFLPRGITGFLTYDAGERTITEPTTIPLEASTITGVHVTGNLTNGTGTVTLATQNERYLVWTGSTTTTPTIWTGHNSYALGQTVTASIINAPAGEPTSIAITTPQGDRIPDHTITATTPGTYTIDALIGTTTVEKITSTFVVRDDNDPARNTPRAHTLPTTTFTDACTATCNIALNETATLEVDVTPGATLSLEHITVTTPENHAPVLRTPIDDVTLRVGEAATIPLGEHFTDPDGDTLSFDPGAMSVATLTIDNDNLTITGTLVGEASMSVYASDLQQLVPSNTVRVTILPAHTENTTNDTNNTAIPLVLPADTITATDDVNSTSVSIALNDTNNTASPLLIVGGACDDPDPNRRPLECLTPTEYFQDQTIYITTTERVPVARITPIGNLLLTGIAHERATFTSRAGDYVIGYEDATGETRSTVWFDSDTGDLYLTGGVLEENANNEPAPGSFVLRNRKGIVLLWATPSTGDVYLRGNLITGKSSIEVRS